MRLIAPSLLVLASLPGLAALDVADDDVRLGLVLQIQVRAERAWSRGNDGNTYNVAENRLDTAPDNADFYLRRLRFGFKGSYQNDYRFAAVFRTDNADRSGSATAANGTASGGTAPVTTTTNDPTNRIPQIHQAYLERVFRQDDAGLEHALRAGLDYAFFNGASAVFSSNSLLFPSQRVTENNATWLSPRGVGIGYKLSGKAAGRAFTWGVDVQNNIGDDSAAVTANTGGGAANNQSGEGLAYTTRLQFAPYDSAAKGHLRTVESFVGAPGTGILVSAEYGVNLHNNTTATQTQNLKAYGFEVLAHHDGLTALVEWRAAQLVTINRNGAGDSDIGRRAFIVQAGYALPLGTKWIEPAFRWSRIDLDHDASEIAPYNGVDYGTSGYQTEVGLNYYLNKHANKLQLAYQEWRGEDGGSPANNPTTDHPAANAHILRAQWQLSF